MDLEVRPNNDLKYQRNLCQAIFGLLQLYRSDIDTAYSSETFRSGFLVET